MKIKTNIKKFVANHPYKNVILIGIISSLFWITIEYIVNKDFYYEGILGLIFYYIIALSSIKFKSSKNKKKDKLLKKEV